MYGLVKLAAMPERKNAKTVYKYLKENYPAKVLSWVKDVDWNLSDRVSLSKIKMARRPGGARERDKVKGIAGAVKEGKPMEPVVLVKTSDGKYKIADGFHRTLGFKHADRKTIKAWVAEVYEDDGPWDKKMHENKLNVGKKADEIDLGILKLAANFKK